MTVLNKFNYFEDATIPVDDTWMKSFEAYRKAIEGPTELDRGSVIPLTNPEDHYSFDYEPCWSAEHRQGETFWIPGYRTDQYNPDGSINKTTGKRPLRTIAYLLCHTDVHLRGNKLVQCCADPYCVNPAHTYCVTNKYKLYDQVYVGVGADEWEDIRAEIVKLEQMRTADLDLISISMDMYAGTLANKPAYHDKLKRDNPRSELTNDQILTIAIQRCAKKINTSEAFGTFDGFLQQYQMRTDYFRLKQSCKDLIETILPAARQTSYWTRQQFYVETLLFAGRLFEEHQMVHKILQLNLLGGTEDGKE